MARCACLYEHQEDGALSCAKGVSITPYLTIGPRVMWKSVPKPYQTWRQWNSETSQAMEATFSLVVVNLILLNCLRHNKDGSFDRFMILKTLSRRVSFLHMDQR